MLLTFSFLIVLILFWFLLLWTFNTHSNEFVEVAKECVQLPLQIIKVCGMMMKDFGHWFTHYLHYILQIALPLIPFIVANCIWPEYIATSNEWYGAIIGVMAAIIGVSLPIAITNISDKLGQYQSKMLMHHFKREFPFRMMMTNISVLLGLVSFFVIAKIDGSKTPVWITYLSFFSLLAVSFSITVFYNFVKMCIRYMFDTDDAVLNICKNEAKKYYSPKPSASSSRHLYDALEVASRIILVKLKSGFNIDPHNVLETCSNIFVQAMTEIPSTNDEGKRERHNLIMKFSDVYLELWRKAYKHNVAISAHVVDNYIDTISKVKDAVGINNDDNTTLLFYLIATELKPEDTNRNPQLSSLPYKWYTESVNLKKDIVRASILPQEEKMLFLCLRATINNGITSTFHGLIEYMVDGLWLSSRLDENIKGDKGKEDEIFLNAQYFALHVAAYGLFKRNYDIVRDYLYYNQPNDGSGTFFGNKDICIDNLTQIIEWYIGANTSFGKFTSLWPDHYNGIPYVKRLLAIVYARLKRNPKFSSSLYIYLPQYETGSIQDLTAFLRYLLQFRDEINFITQEDREELSLPKDNINVNEINKKIEELEYLIDRQEQNNSLDEEKVKNYKGSLKDRLGKSVPWNLAFGAENISTNFVTHSIPMKVPTLLPKSYFAVGDKGVYANFGSGIASRIIDHCDYMIERYLVSLSKKNGSSVRIDKGDMFEIISDLNEDYVVVFVNYMRFYEHVSDIKGFRWGQDGGLTGTTGNGASIVTWSEGGGRPRLYIFKKAEVSKIQLLLTDDEIQVSDLNEKDEILKEYLEKDERLKAQYPNHALRENYLKTQCEITIDCQYEFQHVKDMKVSFLDNI